MSNPVEQPVVEDTRNDSTSSAITDECNEIVKVPSKYARSTFKQEKLRCLGKPIYSDLAVFLIFLGAGCVCAAGCGYLTYEYINYVDKEIDYTHCKNGAGEKCADIIKDQRYIKDGDLMPVCECELSFSTDTDIKAPVGVYIHISNFYQNYRQYTSSIDVKQLNDRFYNKKSKKPFPLNKHCKAFKESLMEKGEKDEKVVFPCGAIAYSWFSDRFQLFKLDGAITTEIPLKQKGIVARNIKLTKMPAELKTSYNDRPPWFDKQFKKPASWRQKTFEDWWNDGGVESEAFVNWMCASAHPDTRKLFRKLDASQKECDGGLCKGKYKLKINYNFEVTSFKGKKSLVFTTMRTYGSKSKFLMIMFGVLAVISLLLAPVLFFSLPNRRQILNEYDRHLPSSCRIRLDDFEEKLPSKESSKPESQTHL